MTKSPNSGRGKKDHDSEDSNSQSQERQISGSVHVYGVENAFPPQLVKEYVTSSQKEDSRENERLLIEKLTLFLVTVVAFLSMVQTRQAIKSADAAKIAADVASESLRISERAYVVIGTPELAVNQHRLTLPIQNSGKVPSGAGEIITHETTMEIAGDKFVPIEAHWRKIPFVGVPIGSGQRTVVINTPSASYDLIHNGTQAILVAGSFTYTDGFPNTPTQTVSFCFKTRSSEVARAIDLVVCDPDQVVPIIRNAENYPNNEEKPTIP